MVATILVRRIPHCASRVIRIEASPSRGTRCDVQLRCAAMDLIKVTGLRALGVHGVLPEEKVRAQPFEIDLEMSVDLRGSGVSDDLDDTVSYADVIESVERVVTHERFELIERLAQRIAEVCRADERVTGVVVEVRKLRPPVAADVRHVSVRITR